MRNLLYRCDNMVYNNKKNGIIDAIIVYIDI